MSFDIAKHPHRFVAACMLAALDTETDVDTTEQAVIQFITQQGAMKPSESAHVEYGCLEHNVVHVCVWDEAMVGHRWVELDPTSDGVSTLTRPW